MTIVPAKRPGRGRRPKAEVREAVLGAATQLLFAEGPASLTVDRVAKCAGVSRVTIHRWWPSCGALAFDAFHESMSTQLPIPDTGDLAADLRTQLRSFVHVMTRTPAGNILREFVGLAQRDTSLREAFFERYAVPRRLHARARIEQAQRAGEVRPDADPDSVVDQLWGSCYYRLLTSDLPVTPEFTDTLVDNVMRGIRK